MRGVAERHVGVRPADRKSLNDRIGLGCWINLGAVSISDRRWVNQSRQRHNREQWANSVAPDHGSRLSSLTAFLFRLVSDKCIEMTVPHVVVDVVVCRLTGFLNMDGELFVEPLDPNVTR